MNTWHLKQAVRCINKGGIIAYPTEAVYGLGCDPFNEITVLRLLALKQRTWQKGLILIAANYAQLTGFLEPLSPELKKRVFATWPGAVTWLLPAKPSVPYFLRGKSNKLAVRVTAYEPVQALCQQWGGALISTSANLNARPAAKTAFRVRCIFAQHLNYILPGKVGSRQRPSEIRDALTNTILRV